MFLLADGHLYTGDDGAQCICENSVKKCLLDLAGIERSWSMEDEVLNLLLHPSTTERGQCVPCRVLPRSSMHKTY